MTYERNPKQAVEIGECDLIGQWDGFCADPTLRCVIVASMEESKGQQVFFTHTVGLFLRDNPEVVATGVEPQSAGRFLSGLATRDGKFKAGDIVEIGGVKARLDKISDEAAHQFFQSAIAYSLAKRGANEVDAVQAVFADKAGHFPDEEGYDAVAMAAQKLLNDWRA